MTTQHPTANPGCRPSQTAVAHSALGQLTLVEHALCPLDQRASLVNNLVFDSQFFFTDANRHTQTAQARVMCPLGLCAGDEYFLWGLLALTLAQPAADGVLYATPHYVLRQLGLIDQHARRGGRQYQQFAAAIERLSLVSYRSDKFYDPLRAEHRQVSFGFLSYSLPLDLQSSRVWRFYWDPLFFELTKSGGGHLWFDLAMYRQLDPASRRLFLFLCKIYSRRSTTPRMNLRQLGESLLGFSPSLITRDLKVKVARCVARLAKEEVVTGSGELFEKLGPGEYALTLTRGRYFEGKRENQPAAGLQNSPLCEPLQAIGFEEGTVRRLLKNYSVRLLQEWSDITLAAQERFGAAYFKRSPQAYFMDNVRHAAAGERTPPDWWHTLRKAEQEGNGRSDRRKGSQSASSAANERNLLVRIRREVADPQTVTDTVGTKPSSTTKPPSPNGRKKPQSSKNVPLESVRSILSSPRRPPPTDS